MDKRVDEDFLKVFDIALIAGRDLRIGDQQAPKVSTNILINETAVRLLGWTDPIGKQLFKMDGSSYTVIGVVRDFHHATSTRYAKFCNQSPTAK